MIIVILSLEWLMIDSQFLRDHEMVQSSPTWRNTSRSFACWWCPQFFPMLVTPSHFHVAKCQGCRLSCVKHPCVVGWNFIDVDRFPIIFMMHHYLSIWFGDVIGVSPSRPSLKTGKGVGHVTRFGWCSLSHPETWEWPIRYLPSGNLT